MKFSARAAGAIAAYATLYSVALAVLSRSTEVAGGESLAVLLIFGLGFSFAAWLVTRGVTPAPMILKNAPREFAAIVVYILLFAALFLGWGLTQLKGLPLPEAGRDALVVAAKLITMVMLPAWLFTRFGYSWKSLLGWVRFDARLWRVFIVMAVLLMAMQWLIGRGPEQLSALPESAVIIAAFAPLAWIQMTLEAGVTEEFLFRVLLQTRAAALLRSETAGIIVMSVLFGLAHAPGYVLRDAYAAEGMTAAPSALAGIAYSIAVVSPIGLMFGVLWARTRNFWLLALLHGWGDLLPNLAPVVRLWLR